MGWMTIATAMKAGVRPQPISLVTPGGKITSPILCDICSLDDDPVRNMIYFKQYVVVNRRKSLLPVLAGLFGREVFLPPPGADHRCHGKCTKNPLSTEAIDMLDYS